MQKSTIFILILIVLIGGYFLLSGKTEAPTNNTGDETSQTNNENEINTPSPAGDESVVDEDQGTNTQVNVGGNVTISSSPQTKTVTYTANGFSPSSITIKAGDSVRFTNNTGGKMWVASDPHPQHTNYSAFDADKGFDPNTSYTYTFTEKGTYTYHDHLHAGMKGTVVVQ